MEPPTWHRSAWDDHQFGLPKSTTDLWSMSRLVIYFLSYGTSGRYKSKLLKPPPRRWHHSRHSYHDSSWICHCTYLVGDFNCSEKIWKSVVMIIPNIWKHDPNVPNHQPVLNRVCSRYKPLYDSFFYNFVAVNFIAVAMSFIVLDFCPPVNIESLFWTWAKLGQNDNLRHQLMPELEIQPADVSKDSNWNKPHENWLMYNDIYIYTHPYTSL